MVAGVASDGFGTGGSCNLRTGDSGRGRDILGRLPKGLEVRPGPTDWLNFGNEGVGGVPFVAFWLATRRPDTELPVGVRGYEPEAGVGGASRLRSLLIGTNIPLPGLDVMKYEMLYRTYG